MLLSQDGAGLEFLYQFQSIIFYKKIYPFTNQIIDEKFHWRFATSINVCVDEIISRRNVSVDEMISHRTELPDELIRRRSISVNEIIYSRSGIGKIICHEVYYFRAPPPSSFSSELKCTALATYKKVKTNLWITFCGFI